MPDDLLTQLPALRVFKMSNVPKFTTLPAKLIENNAALGTFLISNTRCVYICQHSPFSPPSFHPPVIVVPGSLATIDEDFFVNQRVLLVLVLSNTKVRALPPQLLRHNTLLYAFVAVDNELTSVPAGLFRNCPLLMGVLLHGNQLTTIEPDEFAASYANLAMVTLHNNRLTAIPLDLRRAASLSTLSLGQNNISAVDLRSLPQTRLTLDMTGNPTICKVGTEVTDVWRQRAVCECANGYRGDEQFCQPIVCALPMPGLQRASSNCSSNAVGTSCGVVCDPGHASLQGETEAVFTCAPDGRWAGRLECQPRLIETSTVLVAGRRFELARPRLDAADYTYREFVFASSVSAVDPDDDDIPELIDKQIDTNTGLVSGQLKLMDQFEVETHVAHTFVRTGTPFPYYMSFEEWHHEDLMSRRVTTERRQFIVVAPEQLFPNFYTLRVSHTATVGR